MNIAIVTGGTPNLAGPAGVTYLSLRSMSPKLFNRADKYFLSTRQPSERDSTALGELGVVVSIFDTGFGLSCNASRQLQYFSEGILAKFEAFRLSEIYDYVIWMDCDQICVREIDGVLAEGDVSEFLITGGDSSNGWGNFVENPVNLMKWLDENPNISFDKGAICGNFYCVPRGNHMVYKRGRELFRVMESELYGGEQGVLYILMQGGFFNSRLLNHRLFTPHPSEWPIDLLINTDVAKRPYFLHAWAQPKFWNGCFHPLWEHWYREWVGIGGEEFAVDARKNNWLIKMVVSVLSKMKAKLIN